MSPKPYYEYKLVTYKAYNKAIYPIFNVVDLEGISCDVCDAPSKVALVKTDRLAGGKINAGIYNDYCPESCYNMYLIRYDL